MTEPADEETGDAAAAVTAAATPAAGDTGAAEGGAGDASTAAASSFDAGSDAARAHHHPTMKVPLKGGGGASDSDSSSDSTNSASNLSNRHQQQEPYSMTRTKSSGGNGNNDNASVGALSRSSFRSFGALSNADAISHDGLSRGWTDWDREEGESTLRKDVQRQANHLVDEDAGSVGLLSTGGLSLGLHSAGYSVDNDYGASTSSGSDPDSGGPSDVASSDSPTSTSDDENRVREAERRLRQGLERGNSARAYASSAESRFIRPSWEVMGREGLMAKRRMSGESHESRESRASDASGRNVRGPGSVKSMGSIGTKSRDALGGADDAVRMFRRPSLNFSSVGGGGTGQANAPQEGSASRRGLRRPSLDFSIPGVDRKPQPPLDLPRVGSGGSNLRRPSVTGSSDFGDDDGTARHLSGAADAAAAYGANQRKNSLSSHHSSATHGSMGSRALSHASSHLSGRYSAARGANLHTAEGVRSFMEKSLSERDRQSGRKIQRRMRFRTARKVCAALTAVSAVMVGVLAAVLPPDSNVPVVNSVKKGSRSAIVYMKGWMTSEEVDDQLMGTKRSASDPTSQSADRTEALVDAAPSVAEWDEALPAGPGNRKELETRFVGGDYFSAASPNGDANDDGTSRHRPQMRGFQTEGIVGDASSDYARWGGDRARDLEKMHGEDMAQYPDVLPPLHSFNTAERLEDEGIHVTPHVTSNLADVWSLPLAPNDIPLLWSPSSASTSASHSGSRSGSEAIRSVLSKCYGAVEASDLGRDWTHGMLLKVVTHKRTGVRYVNVDVTSPKGLKRANKLNVAASGMVDVAVARDLGETSKMFGDVTNTASSYSRSSRGEAPRGRAFAVFRHPVRNAVSAYRSLLHASHESGRPFGLTLLEYARSDLLEENPLVRSLTGEFLSAYKKRGVGPVTAQHVEVAKEVLRRKVLVGAAEDLGGALRRFESYFGWESSGRLPGSATAEGRECAGNEIEAYNIAEGGAEDADDDVRADPESEEFEELARRNWADVQLYHYARALFEEQGALLAPGASLGASTAP